MFIKSIFYRGLGMGAGIGIDIGGTKMLGILTGEFGNIEREVLVRTSANLGLEYVLSELKSLISKLMSSSDKKVSGIGIALAGAVKDGRSIDFCPNLPFRNFELSNIIESEFSLPCVLSNDVNAALHAECSLNNQLKSGTHLGLFVGTGIGGAIIVDGNLIRGRGGAGEFGHMVVEYGGNLCSCGKRGCLEAYSSKTAMQLYIRRELSKGRLSLLSEAFDAESEGGMLRKGELLRAFKAEDELATEVLNISRNYLGLALINLVNIFHPDSIMLGGGIVEDFYDYYRDYLYEYIEKYAYNNFAYQLEIKKAGLGDKGAALGAYDIAVSTITKNSSLK